MTTYYRVHDTSRSPVESLLSTAAHSSVWVGVVHRECPDCRGCGRIYDEDGEEQDCPHRRCSGGQVWIDSQRGTSVCRSVADLRYYMRERAGYIRPGCVLVACEGDEMDESDVDDASGAVLIQVTRIVSTTPLGADWIAA